MEERGMVEISGKFFLCVIILFVLVVNPCVGAEDPAKFPSRPITMIIQWGAGGVADTSGRKLADLASNILGQPIVVENKPGGGGVTGMSIVAKAEPDGYTIGTVTNSPAVIVPHMRPVPYSTKEDFTWIMQYGEFDHIFCVQADSPWKTFKEFIEEARKNPGKLKYAPHGVLSAQHIAMEYIFVQEKVKVSFVPVGGGAEADRLLLGGHVDSVDSASLFPHLKSGRIRGLMAVLSEKRIPDLPDIPTHREVGYKIDFPNWGGVYAPKGLDPLILRKLFEAFKKAHEDPSFRELLAMRYISPVFRDSDSFKAKVFQDFDNTGKALKELIDLGIIKK
jgi:tripartite-type tricarboxylate transporter receptor subunit TctC